MFWSYQRQEIEQVNDFKNHQLPLARIKKIMKADEDVRMISAEAPILFAKACELFILELTIRSWLHAEENKRRTLQKNDIAAAITRTDIFDFLVDIVPRDEIKDEAGLGGMVGTTASGPPSQAWQSVWQTAGADDGSYASGGSGGQGNLDGQGCYVSLAKNWLSTLVFLLDGYSMKIPFGGLKLLTAKQFIGPIWVLDGMANGVMHWGIALGIL
ncbi:hypothetical protein Gotri_008436, partial [Gossypium trilobum]|nr:hypothetical protein [Gossypium trilobum]